MKEPKLRFKEFKDEWKPRKLSKFSKKINEKNESESYTSVLTNSAVYGVVNQQDFFKKDIANPENIERYTIVKHNDYMYNPRISKYAKFGPVNRNKLNSTGIVSPMYLVFRTDNTVSLGFLDNYFLSSYWHKYVYSKGNTGARADRIAIKDSDFMNMELLMPSLREQQKIAKFFADLDNQIELQSNKLETLKRDKKGYLQKMFPSYDSNKPKLRLKGFDDEWETKELKDIVNVTMGQSPDSKNYTDEKDYNVLIQGNADLKNGYAKPRIYTKQVTKQVNSGDTILTVRAPVGGIAINNFDNAVIGRGVAGISKNKFVFYYLQWLNLSKYWDRLSTGSTFDSINSNDIKELKIKVPEHLNEQVRIAVFLDNLDKQIELQQNKLTDLKNQKKAYLQKMFI